MNQTRRACAFVVLLIKRCLVPGNVCTANLFPSWKIKHDKNNPSAFSSRATDRFTTLRASEFFALAEEQHGG